ncbi:hypothetical protein [Saccharopolyspora gloriosae]|uniref:hypothetical protein n=1 Tax=Saccharopolyspora gloriosae TaxID=455344 RepID=UPI001FB6F42B|nr:hypothetical protein [Saccharopolyspora gloriosae]
MVDEDRVLARAVRAQRGAVVLLVFTALAATGCALLVPAALARAVDAVVSGAAAPSGRCWCCWCWAAAECSPTFSRRCCRPGSPPPPRHDCG